MVDEPLDREHEDEDDFDRPFIMEYEDLPQKGRGDAYWRRQPMAAPNPAAELIRRKLDSLYHEAPVYPEKVEEIKQISAAETFEPAKRFASKHQEYMYSLSNSGKSLAEVQTAWHNYYLSLPDSEKMEVWEEFYKNNGNTPTYFDRVADQVKQARQAVEQAAPVTKPEKPKPEIHPSRQQPEATTKVVVAEHAFVQPKKPTHGTPNKVRQELVRRVSADGRLKAKHHLQSLGFGLTMGVIVIIIFLFSFFNEIIIAPFIQPSRNVSSTPLILSDTTVAATQTPEIIIPKINVQIPVDYSETTDDETAIENGLESGVVHYPSTVLPGQNGNAAFFGHSSNNIFNPGKYKFAFVLLHTLVAGDTFYLIYNGTTYVYQVYQTAIVPPTDVSVLNNVPGHTATATLITCDPPGTSINRLVVWGNQISPNPSANTTSPAPTVTASVPKQLASNGPSLWDRVTSWL